MEKLKENKTLYNSLLKEANGDVELLTNLVNENRASHNGYLELLSLTWKIKEAKKHVKKDDAKTT